MDVYGIYNYYIPGVYKATNIKYTGAPHYMYPQSLVLGIADAICKTGSLLGDQNWVWLKASSLIVVESSKIQLSAMKSPYVLLKSPFLEHRFLVIFILGVSLIR